MESNGRMIVCTVMSTKHQILHKDFAHSLGGLIFLAEMVTEILVHVTKKTYIYSNGCMECRQRKLLYTPVLERFFHAIQSVTLQTIKPGHEMAWE